MFLFKLIQDIRYSLELGLNQIHCVILQHNTYNYI